MNRKRSRSRWAEILGHDTEISGHVGPKYPAQHCLDILELMALANASREHRAQHLRELLTRQRTVEVLLRVSFDARHVSPKLWAQAVQLLGAIGAQAGGWLKSAKNRAPAV